MKSSPESKPGESLETAQNRAAFEAHIENLFATGSLAKARMDRDRTNTDEDTVTIENITDIKDYENDSKA